MSDVATRRERLLRVVGPFLGLIVVFVLFRTARHHSVEKHSFSPFPVARGEL